MQLSDISMTIEDFERCNWQEAITKCEKKACGYYTTQLVRKAREAEEAGDFKAQGVFTLLANICSFEMNLESKETPFECRSRSGTIRTAIPDDITDEQLALLAELIPSIRDAEMRARIADVLWVRNRDYLMAECAVKAYLKSSETLEKIGYWPPISKRLERAMQLALYLNEPLLTEVVTHIEGLLEICDDDLSQIQPLGVMNVIRRNRKKLKRVGKLSASDYAELADRAAFRAEKLERWTLAEQYLSLAASWYATQNNTKKEFDTKMRIAETYVRRSEEALTKRNPPSYFAALVFHRNAISVLRQIPGTEERVAQLHKQLLGYGERSRAEVHPISINIDQEVQESINRDMERAAERVRGKTIQDALSELAIMVNPPAVRALRKTAQDAMNEHPLASLSSNIMLNDSGKVIHTSPRDSDDKEATMRAEMFTHANMLQQLNVVRVIEPARRQILEEHAVRTKDLCGLVLNNPFVPSGREYIFAKGLYAGLIGDFLVSSHLLIPQLENSIRVLLEKSGEITSTLDDRGIQQERDLNKTLYDSYATTLKEILGEDLVFDLRGLLVEKKGANLRNDVAHGLINLNSFSSDHPSCHLYMWWLTLHLCCILLLNADQHNTMKHSSSHDNGHKNDDGH